MEHDMAYKVLDLLASGAVCAVLGVYGFGTILETLFGRR